MTTDVTPTVAARVGGFSLLFVTFLGFFGQGLRAVLIVKDSAGAIKESQTFDNLAKHEVLFRAALMAFILINMLDCIISWSIYVFFKRASPQMSLLCVLFRLAYVAAFLPCLAGSISPVLRALSVQSARGIGPHLQLFADAWQVSFMFFGSHLILLGYLLSTLPARSGDAESVPRWLGPAVATGGVGYILDNGWKLVTTGSGLPALTDVPVLGVLLFVSFLTELLFMGWWILRGFKDVKDEGEYAEMQ
mmetsp:Transcript_60002/g.139775  ORF Transcript_60002/g.139775 Transcript_60002/m.139775 type:complete len:248 (+) Transcript_60002:65-808(+)